METNHNISIYKDKNWTHGSSQFVVLGTYIMILDAGVQALIPAKSCWKYFNMILLENFFLPLHQASRQFSIYEFLRNGPMKEIRKVQTSFSKSISKQLILSKAHKDINIFWGGEQKIIILATLYVIGFFLFLKNMIFCNIRTKIFHEIYFSECTGTYRLYSKFFFFFIIGYIVFQTRSIVPLDFGGQKELLRRFIFIWWKQARRKLSFDVVYFFIDLFIIEISFAVAKTT